MKLTNQEIKRFEQDQKQHGTRAALFNHVFLHAAGLLHDIGAKKIAIATRKERRVKA